MLPPLNTSQVRDAWAAYRCEPSKFAKVSFPGEGRTWELSVAAPAVEAFEALADVMVDWGYLFRESAGGTYNCRMIAGTNDYSIHSYALAIDLNPSKNPHQSPLKTDMPAGFVAAVESIATAKTERQVFQWGGRWSTPDAMHYQIGATPAELGQGLLEPEGDLPLNQDDKDWIRGVVRDEVRWLAQNQQNDNGLAITQVGTAVLQRTHMGGPKGSLAWAVRAIYNKVVGPWSEIELDEDDLGPEK